MASISTMGTALSQIERLKDQQSLLQSLSVQLATSKKTQRFSGLQLEALGSKRARATFSTVTTYSDNISKADQRIKEMLLAIDEFKGQMKNFDAALAGFSKEGLHQKGNTVFYDDPLTLDVDESLAVGVDSAEPDVDFSSLTKLASDLFDHMNTLLNAKDSSGRYLLGGAETGTKPLSNNGMLESAMSQQITSWKNGTIQTQSLISNLKDRSTSGGNLDAITDTIVGYSTGLSSGNNAKIYVRAGENTEIDYTTLANDQAFRDILVGLSFFKNANLPPMVDVYLPDGSAYPAPPSSSGAPGATVQDMKDNFYAVFDAMSTMVNQAMDNIDVVRNRLESVRARIDDIDKRYTTEKNLLQSTIADIENVDMDEVAVKISTLSIQIDASYRVTARMQELSLVNFI